MLEELMREILELEASNIFNALKLYWLESQKTETKARSEQENAEITNILIIIELLDPLSSSYEKTYKATLDFLETINIDKAFSLHKDKIKNLKSKLKKLIKNGCLQPTKREYWISITEEYKEAVRKVHEEYQAKLEVEIKKGQQEREKLLKIIESLIMSLPAPGDIVEDEEFEKTNTIEETENLMLQTQKRELSVRAQELELVRKQLQLDADLERIGDKQLELERIEDELNIRQREIERKERESKPDWKLRRLRNRAIYDFREKVIEKLELKEQAAIRQESVDDMIYDFRCYCQEEQEELGLEMFRRQQAPEIQLTEKNEEEDKTNLEYYHNLMIILKRIDREKLEELLDFFIEMDAENTMFFRENGIDLEVLLDLLLIKIEPETIKSTLLELAYPESEFELDWDSFTSEEEFQKQEREYSGEKGPGGFKHSVLFPITSPSPLSSESIVSSASRSSSVPVECMS